jgi:DegV family protein with EDD domain
LGANAITVSAADSLDGLRLNFALQAGILRLLSRQEHLNKINVFPVPDGDTGTNLALTVHAVLGSLRRTPDPHAGKTLTRVADAALDGARGNSGAILAQFFMGLGDRLGHLHQLDPDAFAEGVNGGAHYARESLSEPREGTILTVLTDFAHAVQRARREGLRDFRALLKRGVQAAQVSLEQTTYQLEALRKANVVDAGAQGFVELMTGVADYIESGADDAPDFSDHPVVLDASGETTAGAEQDLAHRWCTECVVMGERVDRRHLREQLSELGGSLVVAGLHNKVRVHIHVNDPAEVFRVAARFGAVSGEKADDMQRQQHAAHVAGRRVAVVTDSAADIPDEELDRLGIHVVPVRVHFGERSYLDKVGITPEEFYGEIERGQVPKTSQPPPGDFRRQFEFLGTHFAEVVSVNLSSRVSGTCGAAQTAASRVATHGKVTIVDTRNASLGQGLAVMYAAECAAAGYDAERVVAATQAILPRTYTYGLVGSLEYAVRGGRVPGWVQRVADLLGVMPLLHADAEGRVTPGGVLFGRRNLKARFARWVRRRMRDDRTYRVLVGHANCEADGRELLEALSAGSNVAYARLLPLGSALGAHGGPGMLVVGLQEYEAPAP